MKFTLVLLSTSLIALSACATTDAYRAVSAVTKVQNAGKIAQSVTQATQVQSGTAVAMGQAVALTNAAPIDAKPLSVDMRKTSGSSRILKQHPNIAIAGYNIGAYTSGKATSSSGGSLFGGGLGAAATVEMSTFGIDEALVQSIATAAHDDLVAQMSAAGLNVIAAPQVLSAQSSSGMKFETGSYEKTVTASDGGRKRVQVAGPDGVGYRGYYGIGKTTFGSSGSNKLSKELQAVIVSPNLVLDFVALNSKRRSLGNKANASGTVQFSIDPSSVMSLHSNTGKGGGWLTYGIKKPIIAAGDFASVSQGASRTNALEQGLGAALGMGTRAKKTTTYSVAIDPARYEALALKAAKGWNTAFVNQLKEATGK